MSEVYNGQMMNRFTELMDDMQRIYKEVVRLGNGCGNVCEGGRCNTG